MRFRPMSLVLAAALAVGGATPALAATVPGVTRYLTPQVLAASTTFPADRPPLDLPASTLLEPRILEYARSEWTAY